ncbi:MAG TPA: hypothetical protein VE054_06525 [Blattabacteriaceae bacterium]|nr:hypothetical protein [Blattabacteriaceae bacterium]
MKPQFFVLSGGGPTVTDWAEHAILPNWQTLIKSYQQTSHVVGL